jgi:hypothetical protein
MRWFYPGLLTLTTVVVVLFATPIQAQTTTRIELSGQASGLEAVGLGTGSTIFGPNVERTWTPGISGQANLAIAPRVSLEGRAIWFPKRLITGPDQGGRALELFAGIRGTFLHTPRFSVSGVALPGVVRFSNTITGVDTPVGSATRLALLLGVDGTVDVSARLFLHAGAGVQIARLPGSISCDSVGNVSLCDTEKASIAAPWEVATGFGVRLGSVIHSAVVSSPATSKRLTIGSQVAYRRAENPFGQEDLRESAGVGAFALLVSGSKTLHHLLPEIIPPMDRAYTQRFFGWHNSQFQYGQAKCFATAYAALVVTARQAAPRQYVGTSPWNTSVTKGFDNALVGMVRAIEDGAIGM